MKPLTAAFGDPVLGSMQTEALALLLPVLVVAIIASLVSQLLQRSKKT